LIIWFIL